MTARANLRLLDPIVTNGDVDVADQSFGGLLRAFRLRARLTQERLAELAGVSVRAIRNLESGRITTPRESTRIALAEGLEVDGDERRSLVQTGNPRHEGDVAEAGTDRRGIPVPLSSFVGRHGEVESILELLARQPPRLLTLTGVAGIGKTRLALAVAHALDEGNSIDVYWVPLAAITDSSLVLGVIANAVGARAATLDGIARRLGDAACMLAIDNLQHLHGVDAVLTDLIGLTPNLSIVATSRMPLGLHGEHEWPVAPLALPDHDASPGVVSSNPSVALLVDRITAIEPTFQLGDANAAVVAEICRHLDGIPLAVELAAGQWRLRGDHGLLKAVRDGPLDLVDVRGDRHHEHRSMRNALMASYELLAPGAQSVLCQLSVFRGGWSFDAAHDIVDEPDLLEHLDALVGCGLVRTHDTENGWRFTMSPSVQVSAAELAAAERASRSVLSKRTPGERIADTNIRVSCV